MQRNSYIYIWYFPFSKLPKNISRWTVLLLENHNQPNTTNPYDIHKLYFAVREWHRRITRVWWRECYREDIGGVLRSSSTPRGRNISSSNNLFVMFRSDSKGSYAGFNVSYYGVSFPSKYSLIPWTFCITWCKFLALFSLNKTEGIRSSPWLINMLC